jgi:protein-S-isoprenylcysteine O-methyltransferase Ste14
MAWALFGITLLWVTGTVVVLIRRNPGLIAERLGPKKDSKTWDKVIISIVGISSLAKLILAGLDRRYGWTTQIISAYQIPAMIIVVLAYGLVLWSTAVNAFFSQTVRIQKERNHSVCKDGPYRFVRHPGYLGSLSFEFFTPLMLGSLWAWIPGIFSGILFILRTSLEDRTLKQELPGYQDYKEEVHYRLIPGIW